MERGVGVIPKVIREIRKIYIQFLVINLDTKIEFEFIEYLFKIEENYYQ